MNAIKTGRSFYSVTIMTTRDDDGYTTTFDNLREATAFRNWATNQGLFHVSAIWGCPTGKDYGTPRVTQQDIVEAHEICQRVDEGFRD